MKKESIEIFTALKNELEGKNWVACENILEAVRLYYLALTKERKTPEEIFNIVKFNILLNTIEIDEHVVTNEQIVQADKILGITDSTNRQLIAMRNHFVKWDYERTEHIVYDENNFEQWKKDRAFLSGITAIFDYFKNIRGLEV